jgi:hypothetical protein
VKERIAAGECVACKDGDVRKHWQRGNCVRCLNRFSDQLAKLDSDEERAAFEAELYRQGLILNPQEIREIKSEINSENPFAEIRKQIKRA